MDIFDFILLFPVAEASELSHVDGFYGGEGVWYFVAIPPLIRLQKQPHVPRRKHTAKRNSTPEKGILALARFFGRVSATAAHRWQIYAMANQSNRSVWVPVRTRMRVSSCWSQTNSQSGSM